MLLTPVDVADDWTPFYTAVATVSGSLIGLLFVALSVRIEILRSAEHEDLKSLALQTFVDFLAVLVMSLLFLVPHLPDAIFVVALGLLGTRGIWRIARRTWELRRSGRVGTFLLTRFGFSLLGYAIMVLAAVRTIEPAIMPAYGHTLLVTPMILLMMSGTANALHLLVRDNA